MNLDKNKLKTALLPFIKEHTELFPAARYDNWYKLNKDTIKALGLDLKDALQIIDSNQEVAECISGMTWDFIKIFFEASIEVCEELYQENNYD